MTSTSSSAVFCVMRVTRRVRLGAMSTSPSAASWVIASRIGVMDTPSRAAISASFSTVPAGSAPLTISLRSCRSTASRRVGGTV